MIAATPGEEQERRFEYASLEPLGHGSVFHDHGSDTSYSVWRIVPDESGRYDGLVDARAAAAAT